MDFKSNLKGFKAQGQGERKVTSSQQVDFRSVLAKKGGSTNGSKELDSPKETNSAPNTSITTDFRSVLANKKKAAAPEKTVVNNCVGGAKSGGAGGGDQLPVFTEKLKDLMVLDGQRLQLQCHLNNSHDVTITWTLDGKTIKPSKFIVITNEGQSTSPLVTKN